MASLDEDGEGLFDGRSGHGVPETDMGADAEAQRGVPRVASDVEVFGVFAPVAGVAVHGAHDHGDVGAGGKVQVESVGVGRGLLADGVDRGPVAQRFLAGAPLPLVGVAAPPPASRPTTPRWSSTAQPRATRRRRISCAKWRTARAPTWTATSIRDSSSGPPTPWSNQSSSCTPASRCPGPTWPTSSEPDSTSSVMGSRSVTAPRIAGTRRDCHDRAFPKRRVRRLRPPSR